MAKKQPLGPGESGNPEDKNFGVIRPLTDMQKLFVMEYLKDFNGKRAATAAGYSEKTADKIASELLRNPRVATELNAARQALLSRAKIDQDFALRRIKALINSNIKNVLDPDSDDPRLKSMKNISWDKAYGIESIQKVVNEFGTTLKVKMRTPDRAMDMLCKYLGLFEPGASEGQSDNLKSALQILDEEEGKK